MGALEELGQAIKDFETGKITEGEFKKKLAEVETAEKNLKERIKALGREVEKREIEKDEKE